MEDIRRFEVTGEWWLPSEPDKRVYGSLKFDELEGAELRVHGALECEEVSSGCLAPTMTIMGLVRGDQGPAITLVDAVELQTLNHWSTAAGETTEQIFRGQEVLSGHELPSDAPVLINGVTLSFEGMADWVDPGKLISSATEEVNGEETTTLRLRRPASRRFELPEGRLTLSWGRASSIGSYHVSEQIVAFWSFESSSPISMWESWERLRRPLGYFYTLMTGQPAIESDVRVGQIDHERGLRKWWNVCRVGQRAAAAFEGHRWSWPQTLSSLQDPADVVSRWFEVYAECSEALLGLFAVLGQERKTVVETEFLTVALAAEAYHRARGAFSQRKQNYRDRIDELLSYCGPLGRTVAGYGDFAREVKHCRTVLAHGLDSGQTDDEWATTTFWLSKKLQLVLHACLLRDVGLSPDAVNQALMRDESNRFTAELGLPVE